MSASSSFCLVLAIISQCEAIRIPKIEFHNVVEREWKAVIWSFFDPSALTEILNVDRNIQNSPNHLSNCHFLQFQRAAVEGHNHRTVHPTTINEDESAIVRLSAAQIIIIRHRRNATVTYRIIAIRVKESPKPMI